MIKYTQADIKRCISDHKEGKDYICMEYMPAQQKMAVSMKNIEEVKQDIYIVTHDLITGMPSLVLYRHTQKIERDFILNPANISKLILAALADDEVWRKAKGYSDV